MTMTCSAFIYHLNWNHRYGCENRYSCQSQMLPVDGTISKIHIHLDRGADALLHCKRRPWWRQRRACRTSSRRLPSCVLVCNYASLQVECHRRPWLKVWWRLCPWCQTRFNTTLTVDRFVPYCASLRLGQGSNNDAIGLLLRVAFVDPVMTTSFCIGSLKAPSETQKKPFLEPLPMFPGSSHRPTVCGPSVSREVIQTTTINHWLIWRTRCAKYD